MIVPVVCDRGSFPTEGSLFLQLHPDAPGQEVAWRIFYDRYAPIIRGFSRKMGVSANDADDVSQQVIAAFWSASGDFKYDPSRGRFRGYLKTCTWRVVQDHLKKMSRLKERSLDEADPKSFQIEDTWNETWDSDTLHRAVENVRRESIHRSSAGVSFEAFRLCKVVGMQPSEASSKLGITTQRVYEAVSRMSRAIRREMERLEKSVA